MTTVTSKGQATIPKRIRDFLNIKPGESDVEFLLVDDHVQLINKSNYNPFTKVIGITKGKMSTDEIMEMTRGK